MARAEAEYTNNEPVPISDVFAEGLASVEKIGPCVRLTFAVTQIVHPTTEREKVVVAKLVIPADALEAMVRRLQEPLPSKPTVGPLLQSVN